MTDADPATAGGERVGRRAWYALAVLTIIYTVHSVDRSVMSIVLEPMKHEFNLTDSQLGLLTGLVYGLTFALAGLPIGYLIDRGNRRNLLGVLLTIWSACTAAAGFATGFWSIAAARFAVGAAEAGAAPLCLSMIGDLFPEKRRSTAMSIFWSSTALGLAVSFILGSYIAATYGWRAAFFVAGIPGLVMAAVLMLTVRESPRPAPAAGSPDAPTLAQTWRYAIRQPLFVHTFMAITLTSVMLSGVMVWAPSFLVRVHGLDLKQAGLIAGLVAGLCGGVGAYLGGPLGDFAFRKGGLARLPIVPAATTALTVGAVALLAFGPTLPLAVAGLIGFEVVGRTYMGPGYHLIASSLEPRMRGIAVATLQIATNLIGYGMGPLVVGFVSDRVHAAQPMRYGIFALTLVGVWAVLHFLLAYRAGVRREAAA